VDSLSNLRRFLYFILSDDVQHLCIFADKFDDKFMSKQMKRDEEREMEEHRRKKSLQERYVLHVYQKAPGLCLTEL